MTITAPKPEVLPAGAGVENRDLLHRLDKLAWLMDRAVTVPGTRISFGLDALLGLLPFGGDFATGLVQTALVLVAARKVAVPRAVVARMAANVLLDMAVGAIPFVGDLFDVYFKANTRNMALLREVTGHAKSGRTIPSAPSIRYLVGVGAVLVLALVGILALSVGALALFFTLIRAAWPHAA
ncbi:MAG: DUF4112 domain-containing protein [Isosphaeraceae bacterium]